MASAAAHGMLAVVVVQHAQRQPRRVAVQRVHSADGVVEGGGDGDVAGGEDVGERVVVRQGAVAAAVEAFEHGLADGGVFEVLHDGAGVVEFFAGHDEQDLVVGVDGVVEVGALAGVPVGAGLGRASCRGRGGQYVENPVV